MTKIVYNNCYGGFGLSDQAIELYLKLSGTPFTKIEDGGFSYYQLPSDEYFSSDELSRKDPILIHVVESLGDAANGWAAELKVIDLPLGTEYRIKEHDGREWIETKAEALAEIESIEWSRA